MKVLVQDRKTINRYEQAEEICYVMGLNAGAYLYLGTLYFEDCERLEKAIVACWDQGRTIKAPAKYMDRHTRAVKALTSAVVLGMLCRSKFTSPTTNLLILSSRFPAITSSFSKKSELFMD